MYSSATPTMQSYANKHLSTQTGLAKVIGVSIERTHECRREVEAHINLSNLVVLATAQQQQQQQQQQQ
jgi:hypothetical protein